MSDKRVSLPSTRADTLRERQTPRGLLTHAREFLDAATLISESVGYDQVTSGLANTRYHNPFYYLCGHALELAIKSALLKTTSHKELKMIGHDLCACLSRMELAYPAFKGRYDEHKAVVELLNISYAAKEFEYRMTGYAQWPVPSELLNVTEDFCEIAESILRKSVG